MRKKKIIISVLCAALLLLIILFIIPWRTPIDLQMQCTEIAKDGTVLQDGFTLTFKGWEKKPLIPDTDGVSNTEIDVESFELQPLLASAEKPDPLCSIFRVPGREKISATIWDGYDFRSITIYLGEDWKTCLISLDNKNRYFAGSVDGSVPVSDIVETQKQYLTE